MEYRFAERKSYEDFAAGRVLLGMRGASNFPVRLGSELFSRVAQVGQVAGVARPYRVWDPFCGTGYLLTVLGLLHGDAIGHLVGCEVDPRALTIARRNLSLLSSVGLEDRAHELRALAELHGKRSHLAAVDSAERLMAIVSPLREQPEWTLIEADSTNVASLNRVASERPNVVVTDLPYGRLSEWMSASSDPVEAMLDAVAAVVATPCVGVIVSTKATRVDHPGYQRVERISIGKRRAHILLRPDVADT